MNVNYVDQSGEIVAYFQGDVLHTADGTVVGIRNIRDEILDTSGEVVLISFHEGLYRGPNQDPIAWLQISEFAA